MPGRNAHLDNLFDLRQSHIIAMAANVMEDDRRVCLDAGLDDFIAKPIRADGLAEVLNRVPAG